MKKLLIGAGVMAVVFAGTASAEDAVEIGKKKGCMACHQVDKKVVGPAWKDIGAKYKGDAKAKETLVNSINGGSKGKYGSVPMPAQKGKLSDAEMDTVVSYILSL